MIKLKNICFQYPNSTKGLSDVSVEISRGEKLAVLGLNGAGKSTLFLMLCGVLKPQKGTYFLDEKQFLFTKKENQKIGQKIGYVFQDPEVQLFAPTVYDDVAFGLRNMGKSSSEVEKEVVNCLRFLGIEALKDNAPHELSYGQKKLVAIAGVLVMQPELIILDEPFAWLDIVQQEKMKKVLDDLHQQGKTILMSTHNLDFATSWADAAILVKQGKCQVLGAINELSVSEIRAQL